VKLLWCCLVFVEFPGVLMYKLKQFVFDVQIKCTRKCTSHMQYNGGASARSNPQGIVFLKANLNLN
jgi:hypothetical protein